MTSLKDFYDMLEAHDWYYDQSDDNGVWRRGMHNHKRLLDIAAESADHEKLMRQYHNHMFSGPGFNTTQHEKPERPLSHFHL